MKRKMNRKKGLCLLLSAALVGTLIPATALADSSQEDLSLYGLLNWLQSDDCTVELTEEQLDEVESADEFLDKLIGYGYIDPDDEDDAVSLELVKGSLGFIDELNEYRASDDNFEGYSDVVTNWTMLVGSAGTADVSISASTHVSNTAAYNYFRSQFATCENLQWGGSDPMDGWYVAEKELFDKAKKELGYSGYLTSSQVTEVSNKAESIVEEEGTNGYYYVKVGSLSYPLTGVGHYTNLFYGKTELAGVGYTTEKGTKSTSKTYSYNARSITGSSVTYNSSVTYTTSEILVIITEYECWLEGHSYDYDNITWSWADDYSSATAAVTCSTCGSELTVEADVTSETTGATCTAAGSTVYTAAITDDDGTSYTDTKTVTVDALGHSLTKTEQVDATCTEDGTEAYWTCSTCGKIFSDEEGTTEIDAPAAIEATGHSWGDGVVTTEATCTEAGVMTYTCSVCGNTYTEAISAAGHSYESVVTDPTCTESGYTTYTCSVCGGSYTDNGTDPTGHDYDYSNISWTWADDYSSASASVTCSNDSSHVQTVDATVTLSSTEAACTEGGSVTYTASAEMENGSTCTDTQTIEIAANGHSIEYVEARAATCTDDGHSAYYQCTVCGTLFSDAEGTSEISAESVVIAAAGHSYGGKVTKDATCTEAGVMTYTCSACGDTYTEAIPAAGHSYESVVTDPTCTESGYTTYTCSVCGESYTDDVTEALGHSYDDGKVTTEATCTEEGVMTYTCSVCEDTYTEAIEAAGHDYDYDNVTWTWADDYSTASASVTCTKDDSHVQTVEAVVTSETQEAVCTEGGSVTYTASAVMEDGNTCTDVQTIEVEAAGHTVAAVEAVVATCGKDGNIAYYECTVCGMMFSDEAGTEEISESDVIIAATGKHTWNEGNVTTEATCTEDGEITYACSVCGDTYTETIEAAGHICDDGVVTKNADNGAEGIVTYTCSVCGETSEDSFYYVIEDGAGQTIGRGGDLTVTSDGTYGDAYEKFTGLLIDDEELDDSCYSAEEGSVIATVSSEYLDTLDAGNHTLTFVYTDGSVSTSFEIEEEIVIADTDAGETAAEEDGTEDEASEEETAETFSASDEENSTLEEETSAEVEDNTQTGDANQALIWILAMIIAGAAAVGVTVRRRIVR